MDRIAIGIVRRPHGVRGEASVEPWTDSPDRFQELDSVTLVSPDDELTREVSIESSRPHGERVLVKFGGVDSPEEVQTLQNWTVEIAESSARALDEGEYFLHDLVGLRIVDEHGADRGTVTAVLEGGGGLLLTVRKADGREFELPFAAEICTEVDIEGRIMTVHLPAGLDDLDSVED